MREDDVEPPGLTRRAFGALAAAAGLAPPVAIGAAVPDDRFRPQVHYSPARGFMHDPNGLIRHEGEYHLFHQHNPFEAKAGRVQWRHAVSPDSCAGASCRSLGETPAGQAFSGSAVFDRHNSSGLFPDGAGGLVAIYTRVSETRQAQEIASSVDRGRT